LRRGDLGGVPGGLIGTEIAAITEHGKNYSAGWLVRASDRSRMVVRSGEYSQPNAQHA
jgi:hypothetical protein